MAKKSRNEIAVGMTVLTVLLLAIYIVITLGNWSTLFEDQQKVTVEVPYSVGLKGLAKGSPIFLGGAKIGQVINTHLEMPDSLPDAYNVIVSFTMKFPAKYQLRTDCILSADSNVLGGQASLAIKSLGHNGDPIRDGQKISHTLQGGISDAIDNLSKELDPQRPDSLLSRLKVELNRDQPDSLLAHLLSTAENLRSITLKINQQVDAENKQSAVAKLHIALADLDKALSEIDGLIVTNKPPITETIASLRNVAGALEKDTPDILKTLKQALDNADKAMATAKDTLVEIKGMVTANRDTLDRMIGNLNEVGINLKMVSRDVRRAPWKLLYKPAKGESELANLVDSAGSFATGAENLDRAVARLQAVAEDARSRDGAIDKERLDKMMAELEAAFEQYQQAEQKFWKELK